MSGEKRIFMELGDGSDFLSNQKTKAQEIKKEAGEQIQDFALDEALEKLFGKIEILDVSGGMATIAMPIQVLKFLTKFSELLNVNETEIER
jgi:hypothetical protein